MTYGIAFTPPAKKQFDKLERNVRERILNSLERIRVRPYDFIKKLTAVPYYRLRVGDYRLILDIINDQLVIVVIEVRHRRNVYK